MQITEDRKRRVIDLYFNQHKYYAEIAQIEKMSPRDIHAIIKEEEVGRQRYEHQQQRQELSSKAYKLFSEKKTTVVVAIALNLTEPRVSKMYREYCKLKRRYILNLIHKETNGKLGPFLKLYKQLIKEKRMSIEKIVSAVDIAANRLPHIESLYRQAKDGAEKMQCTIQRLANDIRALEHKISILDKIAFSTELDCRRTKQQLQELTAQKDRIEKFIANISNGEGYSKLKQIAKENVKAVLSDNKILLSAAFTAIIQILKTDSQIVNLIQNIPSPNDGEQYKGNNNIVKYFELNKDRILNLGEKNYENLVEALANNTINAAAISNPTPSLRQPSTFPNLSNQNDTYRAEESETYHNSKGDIAD